MQIARENSARNVIKAWESDRVKIGDEWIRGPLIVTADRVLRDWAPADPLKPRGAELAAALEADTEILIVGIGGGPPVPDIELMADFAARAIGLEIMSIPAACRTFNVLLHEARNVVVALCQAPSAADP